VDFEFYRVFSGVVMATNVLEQRLPSRFDIPTTVIYDSMVPRNLDAFEWPKPFILWVANLKRTKRPERLLPLAKPLEEKGVDILMVGAIQQTYYEDFVQALPSNVHYLGARSLQDVDEMMSAARIFVHTCEPEGFGNNFIQAWQQGVPTISFEFDPDGLIEEYQTGVVAHGSERDFVSSVLELVSDEQRAKSLGENGRQMAADLCDIRANAERFIDFFELVLAQKH
jgi:glycosyltransferase involved in cell wall biosynthesis